MRINGIPQSRAFRAIDLDFDSAEKMEDLSNAIAPVRKKLDNLHVKYYTDVWCHVFEEKTNKGKGLTATIIPYEYHFLSDRIPEKTVEIPFQPYKGFDAQKFYNDIKEGIYQFSDFRF